MSTRLILLCQPATAALRAGRFPDDEAPDPEQQLAVSGLAAALERPERTLCGPARCARRTAEWLQWPADDEAALREVDYGRWAGQSLKRIAADEPSAIAAWLSDPEWNGHGGESLGAAAQRVGAWLEHHRPDARLTLAIAPASVIKAAVLHVLRAPVAAYWQLDIAPLTQTALSRHQGKWRLQACGAPAARAAGRTETE
ncbi:histidine phosphatase family protein [Chromobacterium sp. CV08]|uniref:histidine phosphatase family protein n=1 Tax=Chromobacterium sp. CV08 TaxID=3133274 RepID=UPI003DAA2250